jgi:hypothetical protein
MGRTTALRSALKSTLFPLAQARGFVVDRSAQPLFTTFRRRRGDELHVFDIQWDKSGRPRFVINFGKAPAEGVLRQGVPVAAEQIEVYDCVPRLRLQRRRGGSIVCWFQLRRPLWRQLLTLQREDSPQAVAASVVGCFAELEAWLERGECGPHVHGLGGGA